MANWFAQQQYPGGSATFNESAGGYQPGAPPPFLTTPLTRFGTPNPDGTWNMNGQTLTPAQYAQAVQGQVQGGGAPDGTGAAPASGNPTDRNYVLQQIQNTAQQMQANGQYVNPSVLKDPGYWADRIIEKGGWVDNGPQANNIAYFSGRFGMPEGASAGGGGGVGGQQLGGFYLPGAADLGAGAGIPVGGQGLWNGADPTGQSSLAQLAAANLTSSPGYQSRLQQGIDALQRGAAAKGTLLTGGTAKALDRYGQDYAANEYANQYNRLLGEQQTAFGQGLQAQGQGYGQRADAARLGLAGQGQYAGQLYSLANMGMNAAGSQAGMGQTYAGQAGGLLQGQAGNLTNLITGQGNAQSAGTIGAANAWQQGLANATNAGTNAAQQYYLYQLMQGRQGGTGTIPTPPYGYGVLA